MVINMAAEAEEMSSALTADEAEQYDRQIRLWGLDAQKRYEVPNFVFPVPCCVLS